MDACVALTRRVEHLEYDKVAQALEITKLKRRVKKLEKRNKDDAVVLKDDKEDNKEVVNAVKDVEEAKVDESAQDQGRQAESQAEIYKINMDHANKVLSMQEDETEPAEVPKVVDVVTTAKLIIEFVTAASEIVTTVNAAAPSRRRKGVVIRHPESESTTSTIIPAETKSKDKGKEILVVEPKPLKKKQQIEERAAKRIKLDEEVEKLRRHLQIVPNEDVDVYTEATPLARKVPVVDYHVIEMKNKPYYKIIRADDTHQLHVSFLSLLSNFDREDLEALWSLVKERFSTTKPKNFSDDFLLVTLGVMLEKPDIHAQIWKTQKNEHGSAKVKGWKLLESCGVQIITFTSTQLILLVERKYPLTRFTLDEMLNAVRLQFEEEKLKIHKQQIKLDEQYARELHAKLNKDIDWDEAIDHVKRKAKEDPTVKRYQVLKRKPQTKPQARNNMIMYLKNVAGFKMDYFKGMSYDDIRPIFEAKFNSNVAFLLKTKEQIEDDANRALQKLNETPTERAAKRRKLDEEVEELRRHLQIMPNKDDDVYTEATPLARKVPVVDYQVIEMNNKPYYKIIRADDTHQLYLILLAKRKYSLIRFTLDQMLNVVRLEVEKESEVSLELLRFTRQ
uniref:Uncharacterized protein n=1 Tax=Tanacetum cinerariifolium TaxID=118510 RepID=A0A6L2NZJ2_TANCI|nr:hypothetical protein [Tanacetum cinerariifolium]